MIINDKYLVNIQRIVPFISHLSSMMDLHLMVIACSRSEKEWMKTSKKMINIMAYSCFNVGKILYLPVWKVCVFWEEVLIDLAICQAVTFNREGVSGKG